jgi:hypothetical protein
MFVQAAHAGPEPEGSESVSSCLTGGHSRRNRRTTVFPQVNWQVSAPGGTRTPGPLLRSYPALSAVATCEDAGQVGAS